jgi:hypothetical protein
VGSREFLRARTGPRGADMLYRHPNGPPLQFSRDSEEVARGRPVDLQPYIHDMSSHIPYTRFNICIDSTRIRVYLYCSLYATRPIAHRHTPDDAVADARGAGGARDAREASGETAESRDTLVLYSIALD